VNKAFLVVRASIDPKVMPEFIAWYEKEHLPHVLAIPGIVKAYRSTAERRGGNWTAVYELSDDASVQQVLASSEADQARRDWERWMPHVTELSVEVYAPLAPLQAFHRWN
jgi:hypothetical protein